MKNAIAYYYNIVFENIHQTENNYYFDLNGKRYFLLEFTEDINHLTKAYQLQLELIKRNIYIHQIILNKDNNFLTFINGIAYILLQTNYYNEKVTLNKVLSFSNLYFKNQDNINLKELWSHKNDNLAYQITGIKHRYKLVNESFDFFLNLGETSIQLLNELPSFDFPTVIAHKRIKANDKSLELYNPLNLIIDSRVRDVTEYFKAKFFNNKSITEELNDFLKKANLTNNEYYIFMARMLYPTYYFDLYEDIVKGKLDEISIKKIVDKIDDYIKILKLIYQSFKAKINFPIIEWLEVI